jgi:hypothetical protein
VKQFRLPEKQKFNNVLVVDSHIFTGASEPRSYFQMASSCRHATDFSDIATRFSTGLLGGALGVAAFFAAVFGFAAAAFVAGFLGEEPGAVADFVAVFGFAATAFVG